MKIYFSLFIILVSFSLVKAQEFKAFQLYLGLGYAAPTDGGGGVLANLEPAYRVNDAIAIGVRMESAAMAKIVGDTEAKVTAVVSYTINGKYYFSNNNFRPYQSLR